MKLKDFNYSLPKELIAQEPLEKRDKARLMVLDRKNKTIRDKTFSDIIEYVKKGDCIVLNDTRVVPARLFGKRKTGGKVEIFILDPTKTFTKALIRPSKRIKEGEKIELESGVIVTVGGVADEGRLVRFETQSIEEVLKDGHVPLPPYITREDNPFDKENYQTVYARKNGATASPTAGLHFTKELIEELREIGVKIAYVTLHTSYGTFAPVTEENIEDHIMHSEYYAIDKEASNIINEVKSSGGRVIAIGTTSTRVLESSLKKGEKVEPSAGQTNLFIYPGYKFKIIDGIVTNFHLPESTLLMLVSTFAGKDFLFEAYKRAIASKYRFFSYGDAMLIY